MKNHLLPFVGVFFFTVVLLAYSLGGQLFFHFQRHQIRREIKLAIKEGVPEDQLHRFVFAEKDLKQLHWHKSNEFQLGEDFFDVVHRFKNHVDSVVFQCVNDQQEKQLFKHLNQHIALHFQGSSQKKNQESLVIGFSLKYLPPPVPFLDLRLERVQVHYHWNNSCWESLFLTTDSPPPDLA